MALFKLRKGGGEKTRAAAGPGESIEAMRRRARHRLVGAVVLVLAGVIGFPLVFDTQPRPVDVDIAIEIPDKDKARPLAPATPAAAQVAAITPAPAAGPASAPRAAPAASAAADVRTTDTRSSEARGSETRQSEAPAAAPATAAVAPPQAAASKPAATATAKPEPRKTETVLTETRQEAGLAPRKPEADDASRARALLEGRTVDTVAAAQEGRFVVQVGAFAEQVKAREARLKLERAGIKTYTHVADTPAGRRIRVRAGPFPTRAEADRAAEKIKGLDLPAAILTL